MMNTARNRTKTQKQSQKRKKLVKNILEKNEASHFYSVEHPRRKIYNIVFIGGSSIWCAFILNSSTTA